MCSSAHAFYVKTHTHTHTHTHTGYRQAVYFLCFPLCVCHDGKYLIFDSGLLNSTVFFVFLPVKQVFRIVWFTPRGLRNIITFPFQRLNQSRKKKQAFVFSLIFIHFKAKCFTPRQRAVFSRVMHVSCSDVHVRCDHERGVAELSSENMCPHNRKKCSFVVSDNSSKSWAKLMAFSTNVPNLKTRPYFWHFLSCKIFIGQSQHAAVL